MESLHIFEQNENLNDYGTIFWYSFYSKKQLIFYCVLIGEYNYFSFVFIVRKNK